LTIPGPGPDPGPDLELQTLKKGITLIYVGFCVLYCHITDILLQDKIIK